MASRLVRSGPLPQPVAVSHHSKVQTMLPSSTSAIRASLIACLCSSSASATLAQSSDSTQQRHHQDHAVSGGGVLPAGWSARPDDHGDIKSIKFVTMEPGYHLTLGPAVILYRQRDRANGPFHSIATFHQMKKLEHAEGYGLFFGGQSLTGADQKYVYFLVRADGKYLIKTRDGEKTTEISKGWTDDSAITKVDAQGRATNQLEVDAKADPGKVAFKVNGKTVYQADAKGLQLKGIAGLRVNHNLDLHVENFAVHQ